jgi:molybdate transport system substrate-binding protein
MTSIKILSGGAAQGLVASLAPDFTAKTGLEISGEFGAVGGMAEKLRKGAPADVVILTAALLAKLAEERLVAPASIADVGLVETALAVRKGDALLDVHNEADLCEAMLASDAIFAPDTKASTAGIHVAKVLAQIGIADVVAARLKIYPNGATAMRHLASSDARRPIGCTQSTEIISTEGVVLSGSLPAGCALSTMYTAGVTTRHDRAKQADILIAMLTSPDARELRIRAGFLDVEK